MEKWIGRYSRALGAVSRAAAVLAGLCVLATAFIVTYEIVMRGLFNAPTEWVLEISTYLIIAAGFLGMGITLRRRAHVAVDFLTARFSAPVRLGLEAVTTLLSILLFYVFLTESVDFVLLSLSVNKLSPSILRFPLWIPQSALVVGSALLELELVRQFLEDVLALKNRGFEGGRDEC